MPQVLVVKVRKLIPGAKLPRYAHPGRTGDLAADLYASSEVIISPGTIASVSTGIAIELPEGYGALVEDRSGLATQGVTTLAGVVDTGYRGEIRVVLANLGKQRAHIRIGDRVAQLRLTRKYEVSFELADELSDSSRGEQGFGSTGK